MKHLLSCFATGLCLLILAQRVFASFSIQLDLEQLVAQADLIVVASGVDKSARWDRYGRIVSDVTIKIEDSLKGPLSKGQTTIVTTLGGTIGELTMTVPGEADIAIGQPALFFLREASASQELYVVGMSQGLFSIDQRSGQRLVLPAETGDSLYRPVGPNGSESTKSAIAQPTAIDDVLYRIRQLVTVRSPGKSAAQSNPRMR
jgi:hypothetical protein